MRHAIHVYVLSLLSLMLPLLNSFPCVVHPLDGTAN